MNSQSSHRLDGLGGGAGCTQSVARVDQSDLCMECALRGQTCCQKHDIYITWGDCRRIMAHTRQGGFFEYRGYSDLTYADQADDPIWQQHIFRADGSRRVLKQKQNGDCIQLTSNGCSLPLDVRPLVCRLFPHLYSAVGIDRQWDLECPATKSDQTALIETGIAGLAPAQAMQWHQLLYQEILKEGLVDEMGTDL